MISIGVYDDTLVIRDSLGQVVLFLLGHKPLLSLPLQSVLVHA